MKRAVLLVTVLLVLLAGGCNRKEQPVSRLFSIVCSEEGKYRLLLMDEKPQVIKEVDMTEQINYRLVLNGQLAVSADGIHYDLYSLADGSRKGSIDEVNGQLLYCDQQNNDVWFDQGKLTFRTQQKSASYLLVPRDLIFCDERWYILDENSTLYIVAIDSLDKLERVNLRTDDTYYWISRIDDHCCLFGLKGMVRIEDDETVMTYLYPPFSGEITNVIADRIAVYDQEELVVYKAIIGSSRIQLEVEMDDSYYREYDIDAVLSDYLKDGWTVVDFGSIS